MKPSDSVSTDAQFWAAIRRDQFLLDPEVVFLQGGSVGPSPRPVVDTITKGIRDFDSDPLKHQPLYRPIVEKAREKLAKFVGTSAERVALVQNTTMAMSVPAQGLTWEEGDEILTSDQEYGAVRACWDYIAKRYKVKINRVELPLKIESAEQIVDTFKAGFTDRTRAMVFGHVYWSTGLATPIKELTELGRERGAWVIIDGAHAVGMVPLNLDDVHPHFYCSSLHKWILSAKGTGMLYVSEDVYDHVEPLILGGNVRQEGNNASRFDMMGTRDQTPFMGLGAAIDFQNEIGWDRVRAYSQGLAGYLKERLKRFKGLRLLTPADPELSGFITTFGIDGVDLAPIRQELWDDEKIETSAFKVQDLSVMRISTHFYNSREDIDRMISEIEKRL
ncbi:MAG: aminotransferase class V-fold PLP-dependent enzyme [Candidatus Latescibacteria bacterium]|nr:aminotransferase class V-fold PLP-dependent enzyme [Candidatus Latescibacterota bacterium]